MLADKAYDTNEIVAGASARGMNPVIPPSPKSNRKEKRDYDRALYNAFGGERFLGQAVAGSGDPENSLSYLAICRFGPWRFGLNYFDDTP